MGLPYEQGGPLAKEVNIWASVRTTEGSVYRRKSDGRWVGSLSLPDGTRKVFYGKKQSEVIAKIDEALHDLRRGMLVTGPSVTVQEYMEQWLEEIHKPIVKLNTHRNY